MVFMVMIFVPLPRYAGISDKVTSFGIYEYNAKFDEKDQTAHLIAQMIWYFIEGLILESMNTLLLLRKIIKNIWSYRRHYN